MAVISGNFFLTFSFTQTATLGINTAFPFPASDTWESLFGNGVLLNQINLIHAKRYTLAASTPQTPDLTSLLDLSGATVNFARVDGLAYRVVSTNNAFTVLIGGAGTNEWNGWLTNGSKATAFPSTTTYSGFTVVTAPNTTGMAVSGTSKLFKIDPGSNAVGAFDLIIVGRDA